MFSIVCVNWNSYDFLNLLIESLEIYSNLPYELIVIDNSIEKQEICRPNVFQHLMSENIGHGQGLNIGSKLAKFEFVMFLDVDTHVLCHNWQDLFLKTINEFDVIGGKGVPAKPIRPACMFMKKEISLKYDWRPTDGYKGERGGVPGFDVAIQAYHQMVKDGVKIKLLEHIPSRYETIVGEEFCIDGEPICYHHWHATHLKERQIDFPNTDLFKEKDKLFSKIPWRML